MVKVVDYYSIVEYVEYSHSSALNNAVVRKRISILYYNKQVGRVLSRHWHITSLLHQLQYLQAWMQNNELTQRWAQDLRPNLHLTRYASLRVARFALGWNSLSNFSRHVSPVNVLSYKLIIGAGCSG
jgi:hypothetical protein